MPRQPWLGDQCRRFGLAVVEVDGWRERGSEAFSPWGVIAHHTAGAPSGEMPSLRTLVLGRPDLPGPLANIGLGRSGTVYVVAAGRANHAGAGGWQGLVGNSSVLGIEAESAGDGRWTDAQRATYPVLASALKSGCQAPKDYSLICAHREWAPTRKIDPRGIDMADLRRRAAALAFTPLKPLEDPTVPVVVARPQGGHIVVGLDGGVFAQGGAPYLRSLPELGVRPSAAVVGGAWTPSGQGYWLVAKDGALYAFGDASPIQGGNVDPLRSHLAGRPVVGVVSLGPSTVQLVAYDASGDPTPFDGYQASA